MDIYGLAAPELFLYSWRYYMGSNKYINCSGSRVVSPQCLVNFHQLDVNFGKVKGSIGAPESSQPNA